MAFNYVVEGQAFTVGVDFGALAVLEEAVEGAGQRRSIDTPAGPVTVGERWAEGQRGKAFTIADVDDTMHPIRVLWDEGWYGRFDPEDFGKFSMRRVGVGVVAGEAAEEAKIRRAREAAGLGKPAPFADRPEPKRAEIQWTFQPITGTGQPEPAGRLRHVPRTAPCCGAPEGEVCADDCPRVAKMLAEAVGRCLGCNTTWGWADVGWACPVCRDGQVVAIDRHPWGRGRSGPHRTCPDCGVAWSAFQKSCDSEACRAAVARAEREQRRREIDAVLREDARRFPAFAVARRAAVLAICENRDDGPRPEEVAALLANLRVYEDDRGAGRVSLDMFAPVTPAFRALRVRHEEAGSSIGLGVAWRAYERARGCR